LHRVLSIPLFLFAFAGLAVSVQARSWGFDKDTVQSGSSTMVWLTNTGADTLKLDSVLVENALGDDSWSVDFKYQSPSSTFNVYLDRFELSRKALSAVIAPGQNVALSNFRLGNFCPTGDGASSAVSGSNTIIARIRFKSRIAEEDTLLIKGAGCGSSALLPGLPDARVPGIDVMDRDALGRDALPAKNFPAILRRP
jgi:hypothetical protein